MTERSDLDLFARALRNDWPIPPDVKKCLLQAAINIAIPFELDDEPAPQSPPEPKPSEADDETDEDHEADEAKPAPPIPAKPPSKRTRLAALKVIALFQKLTIDQQRLDLLREKLDGTAKGFDLTQIVAEAEDVAATFVADTKPS